MKTWAIKVILSFFYLSILVRPVLPTMVYELGRMAVDAKGLNHSWLVQQLLKQVENEKDKYAASVKSTVEANSLSLPFSWFLETPPLSLLKGEVLSAIPGLNPREIIFSFFHPPRKFYTSNIICL